LYHPSLSIENNLLEIIEKIENEEINLDFLVIEGSITENKNFHRIGDYSIGELINKLKDKASYVIAAGNCAVHLSPAEKAIIGLDSQLKAEMVLRSFDVCSVCTTH
jgi:Ni,Fe-hydrogenase I small subunit